MLDSLRRGPQICDLEHVELRCSGVAAEPVGGDGVGAGAGSDAGTDAGADAGADAGTDAETDAEIDAEIDAETDAEIDADTDTAGGVEADSGADGLAVAV